VRSALGPRWSSPAGSW